MNCMALPSCIYVMCGHNMESEVCSSQDTLLVSDMLCMQDDLLYLNDDIIIVPAWWQVVHREPIFWEQRL